MSRPKSFHDSKVVIYLLSFDDGKLSLLRGSLIIATARIPPRHWTHLCLLIHLLERLLNKLLSYVSFSFYQALIDVR